MSNDPNPDPASTPGLEAGGGVRPGDTPPAEGQATAASAATDQPNVGPVSGNRTPMTVALVALAVIVVMVALLVGASFIPS